MFLFLAFRRRLTVHRTRANSNGRQVAQNPVQPNQITRSSMQSIVKRIFGDRKLPENMSDSEYESFMQQNFTKWVTEFEDSGFLDATKLTPIANEDELVDKMMQHPNDLIVVKYFKRGCIPCLSLAEMYKAAEQRCATQQRPIRWFSVDTKSKDARDLVDYQIVDGTPTIQTFYGGKQVGSEIRATQLDELMATVESRLPLR